MSTRKTLTLTTLSSDEPASVSTAWRDLMQAAVFSWMVPSIRLPSLSAGICPEQKMAKGVLIAWDCRGGQAKRDKQVGGGKDRISYVGTGGCDEISC